MRRKSIAASAEMLYKLQCAMNSSLQESDLLRQLVWGMSGNLRRPMLPRAKPSVPA